MPPGACGLCGVGGGVFVGEGQPFGLQGFGPGAGLDAVFVRAGTGAPDVAVGEQQQPAGVIAFGGDDEDDGGLVLSRYLYLVPAGGEDAATALSMTMTRGQRLSYISLSDVK